MAEGRIKGAAIRSFLDWYVEQHGRDPVLRALSELSEDRRERFDLSHVAFGVLPSEWFPAPAIHTVLDRLTGELAPERFDQLAKEAGDATVRSMMTGVQRMIFSKLMTPGAYLRIANLAFKANYSPGYVKNVQLAPNRHRGTSEDWAAHHPFLCRMNVAIKAGIYDAMGCRSVRIEERYCRTDGDEACGSVIAWD